MQYSSMFDCHSSSSVFCPYWCYEIVVDWLPTGGSIIIIIGVFNHIFYLNGLLEGIVIIFILVISLAVAIIIDGIVICSMLNEIMTRANFKTSLSNVKMVDPVDLIPASTKSKTWQEMEQDRQLEHQKDIQQRYFYSYQP